MRIIRKQKKKILQGPKMNKEIKQALSILYNSGKEIKTRKWQAVESPDIILEVSNLFFTSPIPLSIQKLSKETGADLPWSEDHFRERIGGSPLNPGDQYKNWPYYRASLDDKRFKSHQGDKFSHTYMERYWPPKEKKGIRYKNGDLRDIIQRLEEDPYTRQAYLSIWHPEDQSNNEVRLPCTLGYWFNYRKSVLNCTYHIRSCDAIRHFRNDIYMTCRLVQHIAEKLGVYPGKLSMWIGSFHVFKTEKWKIKTKE